MSKEEIKEIAREEMLDTIKSKLDSSMIFTYINNLEQESKQLRKALKEEITAKKKAREFIYRYWITYDESKNFAEFNEEMNILIKDINKLLEILEDKENE